LKILIIRLSSLGDVVLTTPVPRLLKKKFPNSEIHFITKSEYSDIYINNNNVNKVINLEQNLKKTIKFLKSEKYDLVIDLHNNLRSNVIKYSLSVKHLTYNKQFFARWLFSNFKINLVIKHITKSYIETLNNLDIEDDDKGLDLFLHEKDLYDINKMPIEFRNGFYVLVLGGKYKTKRLPVDK
jgi:ADP-heptose:LPS heptosyltransferase